jgi:3-phenylpropionate/trans-cinnamate dioxygenase alpha subunit
MVIEKTSESGFGAVSVERAEIDRRIFSDPEIFDLEMEVIFGRAWLFLCHETQIARAGDFFEAPMGRDHVLVVRQRDGSIKALLNTCTHRGNAVCRAEEGNTKNFMCTYHGWTFALDGQLIGVPGFENLYHSELDKAALGLREVAQIDSYNGFVFATMDPSAPPLDEYLGETGRLSLNLIAAQGDMEAVPGVQKFVLDCNWKFSVDNVFDWYHAQVTHMSAFMTGLMGDRSRADNGGRPEMDVNGAATSDGNELELAAPPAANIVVLGEYGHAISGPSLEGRRNLPSGVVGQNPNFGEEWRESPRAQEMLGPVGIRVAGHPNIFPTTWITRNQISLRVPRSPLRTEIWWFTFVDKNASPEVRSGMVTRANHVFGPAGFLEQEDGENWSQSTRQTRGYISKNVPQVLKMDHGRGKVIKEGGLARIEGNVNEHAQLWTYKAWDLWMSGASWEQLKAGTAPGDVF